MKEINTIQELIHISEEQPSDDWVGGWFYRGQSIKEWELTPKAYRFPHINSNFESNYYSWEKQSCRLEKFDYENEFEGMAIAQHHGFPTKYLDWSSNILIAAFFACSEHLDQDGRLFAYFPTHYITEPNERRLTDYDDIVAFQPRPISDRIQSQLGVFTFHPNEKNKIKNKFFTPARHYTLHDWIIPSDKKIFLLKSLDRLGINFKTIFPDLDDLSKHYCLMDEINIR